MKELNERNVTGSSITINSPTTPSASRLLIHFGAWLALEEEWNLGNIPSLALFVLYEVRLDNKCRRVQITPKTSTNITPYLYSRGPVRQVCLLLTNQSAGFPAPILFRFAYFCHAFSVNINVREIRPHGHKTLACWIINLLLDVLLWSIAENFYSLIVCILTSQLTIRPVARKAYGSIAHEAKPNGLLTREKPANFATRWLLLLVP